MSGLGNGLIIWDVDRVLVERGEENRRRINCVNTHAKTEYDILENVKRQAEELEGTKKEELERILYSDITPIDGMCELPGQYTGCAKVVILSYFPHKGCISGIDINGTQLVYDTKDRFTGELKGEIIKIGKIGVIKRLQRECGILPQDTLMIEDGRIGDIAKKEGAIGTFIAFNAEPEIMKDATYSTSEAHEVKKIIDCVLSGDIY